MGIIINSCMAILLPACDPPLMTLKDGTGSDKVEFPANEAMCWKRGIPRNDAPALAKANETPKIAFAPSLPKMRRFQILLLAVPSREMSQLSSFSCSFKLKFCLIKAGPITVFTFSTAFKTPQIKEAHTGSLVAFRIIIAEFTSFMNTSRSTRRNCSSEYAFPSSIQYLEM